jgi:outer membrane protein
MTRRLCVSLLLLAAAFAFAEDAAPLSLKDCIDIALQRQTAVLQGANAVEGAKARETQAKGAYYPQVGIQQTTLLAESGRATGARNGASLTVTENFYDGGLREARVSGAKAAVTQSGFTLARTKQTVVFTVTRNYFSLLRARHLAAVQQARVTYLDGNLELVKARVEAGDAAEVDQLPVQAQLANARVDLLAANTAIRTATVQLQQSMGLAPSRTFAVTEFATTAALPVTDMETYLARAAATRPEVGETQAGVQAARASEKSAKIALQPRLVVNGSFDQPIASSDPNAMTITGGIAYDLFNGGSNRAAYREAQAGRSTATLRAEQIGRDIQAEVEEAYLNLASAKERLAASDLSLAAAQKNFDAQQDRYKQGLAIPLDLLNAQVEVVTAQSNAVQARYDYYTFYAQLEYAIGTQGGLYAN